LTKGYCSTKDTSRKETNIQFLSHAFPNMQNIKLKYRVPFPSFKTAIVKNEFVVVYEQLIMGNS